jgi:hypothetical protein
MALVTRELYHSSNGDRWYLARDLDTVRVFITYQANLPKAREKARCRQIVRPSVHQYR